MVILFFIFLNQRRGRENCEEGGRGRSVRRERWGGVSEWGECNMLVVCSAFAVVGNVYGLPADIKHMINH